MTGILVLRPATGDDDEQVGAVLAASYPVLMRTAYSAEILRAALPLMTKANPALLSSGTYYVAEDDRGRVIGCGGWTLERPGSSEKVPGLAHIRHFATHPDWIGRGVGRAIFDLCETAARSTPAQEFECHSSLNAQGFYESLGFVARERFALQMGPNIAMPSVRMRRPIQALSRG